MTMLRSIILLLGLATTVLSLGCPPYESIFPCTCDEPVPDDREVEATVKCYGEKLSQDMAQSHLRRILATFDQRENLAVELSGFNLREVPRDFFQGLNVKRLMFWQCQLQSWGDIPLLGLEDSLEDLTISTSVLNDDSHSKLRISHFNRLKELQLSYISIPRLGDDWFSDAPKSLTHLIFSSNDIAYPLGDKAFAGLENLEVFFMEGNRIGSFKRSMLPNPANNLVELDLQLNDLTSLPEDMFSGMPSLKSVSLMNNRLNKMPKEVFGTVWEQLEKLDMFGNSLKCDSHLEWMLHAKSQVWLEGTCQTPPEKEGVELNDVLTGKVPL